jgi:hypothetical protein
VGRDVVGEHWAAGWVGERVKTELSNSGERDLASKRAGG